MDSNWTPNSGDAPTPSHYTPYSTTPPPAAENQKKQRGSRIVVPVLIASLLSAGLAAGGTAALVSQQGGNEPCGALGTALVLVQRRVGGRHEEVEREVRDARAQRRLELHDAPQRQLVEHVVDGRVIRALRLVLAARARLGRQKLGQPLGRREEAVALAHRHHVEVAENRAD
jgi:hypothetical protein